MNECANISAEEAAQYINRRQVVNGITVYYQQKKDDVIAEQDLKISTYSARIKQLQDEVKQLQEEIAELKNNPDDPWKGVLNEEGEL